MSLSPLSIDPLQALSFPPKPLPYPVDSRPITHIYGGHPFPSNLQSRPHISCEEEEEEQLPSLFLTSKLIRRLIKMGLGLARAEEETQTKPTTLPNEP